MIIGLTGSIGTGKTTVCKMFEDLGAHVVDYDRLAKDVVEPGREAYREIVEEFGPGILQADKTLDRKKLGDLVFEDKDRLKKLNAIVHPRVFMEDRKITAEILQNDPSAIIVKEVPLLTQIGINPKDLVDQVVVVSANYETQLARVMGRGFGAREAKTRIASQTPVSETEKLGDFVVQNNGSFEETKRQVEDIYQALKTLAGKEK